MKAVGLITCLILAALFSGCAAVRGLFSSQVSACDEGKEYMEAGDCGDRTIVLIEYCRPEEVRELAVRHWRDCAVKSAVFGAELADIAGFEAEADALRQSVFGGVRVMAGWGLREMMSEKLDISERTFSNFGATMVESSADDPEYIVSWTESGGEFHGPDGSVICPVTEFSITIRHADGGSVSMRSSLAEYARAGVRHRGCAPHDEALLSALHMVWRQRQIRGQ